MDYNGLQVGDRVICAKKFAGVYLKGKYGTVIEMCTYGDVGVEFDECFEDGHSCNGLCEDGHGRWGDPYELIRVEEPFNITFSFDELIGEGSI